MASKFNFRGNYRLNMIPWDGLRMLDRGPPNKIMPILYNEIENILLYRPS